MNDRSAELRAYYAARAPEYDEIYQKPERQPDLRRLERWIPDQLRDRRVLEIACGTGYWTQFLGAAAAHVTGIDVASETLAIARARVPRENVDLRVCDAYALTENLGRFDAAFAGFWLSHVPKADLPAFVSGLHARLVARARVVFIDNRFAPGSSQPIVAHDIPGNTYQERRLRDGSVHRVLKNFLVEEDLRPLLRSVAATWEFCELRYYWTLRYELA